MADAMRAMRPDEPVMIAWKEHQSTEVYQNSLRWAGQHAVGELWASFLAGWKAAGGKVDER